MGLYRPIGPRAPTYDTFTEEGMGAEKAIFEGVFKFGSSEVRKKFDSKASEFQIEEYWSASPSTQEYQKLKSKLNHDSTRDQSGRNWGVIALLIFLNVLLMM